MQLSLCAPSRPVADIRSFQSQSACCATLFHRYDKTRGEGPTHRSPGARRDSYETVRAFLSEPAGRFLRSDVQSRGASQAAALRRFEDVAPQSHHQAGTRSTPATPPKPLLGREPHFMPSRYHREWYSLQGTPMSASAQSRERPAAHPAGSFSRPENRSNTRSACSGTVFADLRRQLPFGIPSTRALSGSGSKLLTYLTRPEAVSRKNTLHASSNHCLVTGG